MNSIINLFLLLLIQNHKRKTKQQQQQKQTRQQSTTTINIYYIYKLMNSMINLFYLNSKSQTLLPTIE